MNNAVTPEALAGQFPDFSSSNPELDRTYVYRKFSFASHIKKAGEYHVVTEFLPDVPWAGKYNTISCAALHHFNEGRWLANPEYLESYADFWCSEGDPMLYSFPAAEGIASLCRVTGNNSLLRKHYKALAELHDKWVSGHCRGDGLFYQIDDRDGMEYSISGSGKRPTINSYMYAEKSILSEIAFMSGDFAAAAGYKKDAAKLAELINSELWNEDIGIYATLSEDSGLQNVRELIGYIPWCWHIPPAGRESAFAFLKTPDCFQAKYGLTTADRSHPEYMRPYHHECLWNGPVWPFATTQTLNAVISLLHNYRQSVISNSDFTDMLTVYASSQKDEDQSTYVDENLDPDTGIWLARSILRARNCPDRGCHYNHSAFIDLVLTGICGIIPSLGDSLTIAPLGDSLDYFKVGNVIYHKHEISIEWDKKSGLTVKKDGKIQTEQSSCKPVIININ